MEREGHRRHLETTDEIKGPIDQPEVQIAHRVLEGGQRWEQRARVSVCCLTHTAHTCGRAHWPP